LILLILSLAFEEIVLSPNAKTKNLGFFFGLHARKYRGLIPPITATSLRQAASQKPEKSFLSFERMMEASP
jgi:hypothetical protein